MQIDQASNNAQSELQSLLTDGVEVTLEDGDVMVSDPQDIIDVTDNWSEYCDELQDKFNSSFKEHLITIYNQKIVNEND